MDFSGFLLHFTGLICLYFPVIVCVNEVTVFSTRTEAPDRDPVTTPTPKDPRWLIVGSSVAAIVLVLVPVLIFVCIRLKNERRRRKELESLENILSSDTANATTIDPEIPITEQAQLLPYESRWEVLSENLEITNKVLGSGHFGRVVIGFARNLFGMEGRTTVAVKMLKETEDYSQRKALLGEIKIMAHIGQHVNVVNLLGAITKNMARGGPYMLTEYCQHGSLLDYLRRHQDPFFLNQLDPVSDSLIPITTQTEQNLARKRHYLEETAEDWDGIILTTDDLICYAFQISNGMSYLTSKNVLHRDLAARNVLVAEDNVAKICDFGLARQDDTYVQNIQGDMPWKWMAPESIAQRKYTRASDVWSFGILLWEVFTLGRTPYPELSFSTEFYQSLQNGYRMERPYLAPRPVDVIMRRCWERDPQSRPDFTTLSAQFGNLLDHCTRKKYLDKNTPYELYNREHETSGYLNDHVVRRQGTARQPDDSFITIPDDSYMTIANDLYMTSPATPDDSRRQSGGCYVGTPRRNSMEVHPLLFSTRNMTIAIDTVI